MRLKIGAEERTYSIELQEEHMSPFVYRGVKVTSIKKKWREELYFVETTAGNFTTPNKKALQKLGLI